MPGATAKAMSRLTALPSSSVATNAPSSTPSIAFRWWFRCASDVRLPATLTRSAMRPCSENRATIVQLDAHRTAKSRPRSEYRKPRCPLGS